MRTSSRLSAQQPLQTIIRSALEQLADEQVVERLWAKDHTLWKPDPTEIDNRLGWLTVVEQMREQVGALRTFAQSVKDSGFRDVVLLGMGGSSLGPEVLRRALGSTRGFPRLWVLDSTVPQVIREVTDAVRPAQTLFIVASKSGGTIEVMSLFAHFWELVARTKGARGGTQFIAITDPGTSLEKLAGERGFWQTFANPPDIGGRYSVLSYFGLVPAALMGLDLAGLLDRGTAMAEACRCHAPLDRNPGAYLGAVMGALGRQGRDKVSLLVSPGISGFGLWAEQLLAESTGKEGKGLVPVADEPLSRPAVYGNDRLFVYLRLKGDRNDRLDRHVMALERTRQPVVRLELRDRYDLAAEFFRWEFATAVAGYFLGIHPFDQPNVQESKDKTKRVLQQVEATGRLPRQREASVAAAADTILRRTAPGRYVAVLAYVPPSRRVEAAIQSLRKTILATAQVATTAGYGPRYLHSTGQLHKGGPNTGLFLQLIDEMTPDLAIPGKPYTFGTLARAQALGDLQSLLAHGRTAVSVNLARRPLATIKALAQAFRALTVKRRRAQPGGPRTTTGTHSSSQGGLRQKPQKTTAAKRP
ncbi:glucose-6-phosphate isomerase [Nitrospira calida]